MPEHSSPIATGHCTACGTVPVRRTLRASTTIVPHSYRITEESHATCWDIVQCSRCGLQFSQWTLTPEQVHALYAAMTDALYDEEEWTRRSTYQKNLALIERCVPRGRLLDIGCATGGFLQEAQERGWTVEGIDLSQWAVDQCHRRGIVACHCGTIDTLPNHSMRFDAVTMLDYIEHDTDPRHLLVQVRTMLKPGGIVYISTPDIGGFVARLLGKHWWGINPLHLTYFSRATLRHLLEQEGFDVVLEQSYARRFTLAYWASRLEHFHPLLARCAVKMLHFVHLAEAPLSLTIGDAMEVIARKRN